MATLCTNIIVPLQPHEIQAGLNNSPYYHLHSFKSSGRSIEGLHPIPLRYIAMLSSEERTELLSQCEEIELHWDLDTPRDEKWRYMETRKTLAKWSQYDYGHDQDSKAKSLAASSRRSREEALHELGTASSNKTRQASFKTLTPDEPMSERDRILNMIAPQNNPVGVSRMKIKTASDEELLHAAHVFKTSADQTEEKFGFPPFAFSQGPYVNKLGARRTTTPKSTRSATSTRGAPNESFHKPLGAATRDPLAEEQRLQNGKEFQRAVAAAAEEDPLSVAALIAKWEIKTSLPKTSTSTGTEQEPSAAPLSQPSVETPTVPRHSYDEDACTVESLENLSESDDVYVSSHSCGEIPGFLVEDSDTMSHSDEEDMYHTTVYIGSDAHNPTPSSPDSPSTPSETSCAVSAHSDDGEELAPEAKIEHTHASIAPGTESLYTMAPTLAHEGKSLVSPSIEATTHPPDDQGTHTPKEPVLIMPTFPLTPNTEVLNELVSNHETQVLQESKHRAIPNATTTDPLPAPELLPPSFLDRSLVIAPIDRVATDPNSITDALVDGTPLSHRHAAHAHLNNNENELCFQNTQQPDYVLPSDNASGEHASYEDDKQTSKPNPQHIDSALAQPALPVATAHVYSDDPIHEAVVFPNESMDKTDVRFKKPSKVKPDVPPLLNLDGEQIDDWAQGLLAAIQDHTSSQSLARQQMAPTENVDDAMEVKDFVAATHIGAIAKQKVAIFNAAETSHDENIEAFDNDNNDHIEVREGEKVEAQPPKEEAPKIDLVENTPELSVQPTTINAPAAGNEYAHTPEEWTSLVHLASYRPLQPDDPVATLLSLLDRFQPPSIYPLTVVQQHELHRSAPAFVPYLRIAADHLSSIFSFYVLISFFKPDTRASRHVYLVAGALLGGVWIVLYCLRRKTTGPCHVRFARRSKRITKKSCLSVFVALLAVAVVVAAVAHGTWPNEDSTTVVTSHTRQTENKAAGAEMDICPSTLDWASVFDSFIACDANTPTSVFVVPRDSAINDDVNESGSESDSDSDSDNAQTSTTDSYGAPNAVAKDASADLVGPLWGLGISVLIATVKYWWAQRMFDRYLQNHP
ncbi:hypothetical protein P171DRAFT_508640 [Karstenula rhodostoma CBS 690.94]|uniref:Uncharacterized protein n=1 Tax=Karstenula rhodostoma CBS 690.94 TaxID=1392251 RepID=A0A9P4PTB0_9PLEO|nr:hypothetical protein P171DRAFT_508640 [Karstenula rhodostoma CBS 690.94]